MPALLDIETLDIALNAAFVPLYFFIALTVHEFGHYMAARFFNIGIEEFSLGYGRKVWERTDSYGTRWAVRLYPICGHVHLSGVEAAAARRAKKDTGSKEHVAFVDAPAGHRFVTVAAGPAVNILLALAVFFLFFASIGQPARHAVVSGVETGWPAERAGLQYGDRFIAINGRPVARHRDIWDINSVSAGKDLDVQVVRGDEIVDLTLTPRLISYVDSRGLKRTHGRSGMLIGHTALDFSSLHAVDGLDVAGDSDKARALLAARTGQPVTLKLLVADGALRSYRTILDPVLNDHFDDPANADYDVFYLGPYKDNFYLQRTVDGSFMAALEQTGRRIINLAQLPFQLFPIDRKAIRPWASVDDEAQFTAKKLYDFTYRLALVSVFIALINLLPFPGLDGSLLLQIYLQAVHKLNPPERSREYKYLVLLLLSTLYLGVIIANVADLPGYMSYKYQQALERRL